MTTVAGGWGWWPRLPERRAVQVRAVEAPPRPRRPGPIFIGDAVTPWAGETLLLSVLRDQALAAQEAGDDS